MRIRGVRQSARGDRLVTFYHIETTDGATERLCAQVFRRYAQFERLKEVAGANAQMAGAAADPAGARPDGLEAVRPAGKLPPLPPKLWFNTRPAAIAGRQHSLQAYLRDLQAVLPTSPDLWSFVGVQVEPPPPPPPASPRGGSGGGAVAATATAAVAAGGADDAAAAAVGGGDGDGGGDGGGGGGDVVAVAAEEEGGGAGGEARAEAEWPPPAPRIQYLTEFDWAYHSKDGQMMRKFAGRAAWCSMGAGGDSDDEGDSAASSSGRGNGLVGRLARSLSNQSMASDSGSKLDADQRS